MAEAGSSFSRRKVLAAAAGSLIPMGCQREPPPRLPPERQRDAARVVGKAWLERHFWDPSAEDLVRELTRGAPSEAGALGEYLFSRHLADLAEGRLESVEGWVLSATEVKLYALVALS